jgi:hypothetical protein
LPCSRRSRIFAANKEDRVKQSARLRESLLGKALDPFSGEARKHVALVAVLAWVGLGADGLSSACYGPEEAFLALGPHTPLSLYLAAMTAVTVFVIAVAYNQVIELSSKASRCADCGSFRSAIQRRCAAVQAVLPA